MRIALVNTCIFTGRGSDLVVCELAESLSARHQVTIFVPFGGDIRTADAVEVVGCGARPSGKLQRLRQAIRVLRQLRKRSHEFDVINCHHALLSLLLPPARLVTTYHGYSGRYHYQLGAGIAAQVRRLVSTVLIKPALRRSVAATVVSRALLAELGGESTLQDVRVIHNGVKPLKTDGPIRERPGLRRYFLYCGRIDHDKGVDRLVELYVRLDLDVPLLLAGDGPLRASLECEFGGKKVVFLGMKKREELPALYHDAIAFVTASTYESFCLPVIEAAMFGRPSVGPSSGAIAEVSRIGVTGYLFDNEEQFGHTLAALHAKSDVEWALIEEACRAWANNFRWERKTEKYLEVFTRAAGAVASAPRVGCEENRSC